MIKTTNEELNSRISSSEYNLSGKIAEVKRRIDYAIDCVNDVRRAVEDQQSYGDDEDFSFIKKGFLCLHVNSNRTRERC